MSQNNNKEKRCCKKKLQKEVKFSAIVSTKKKFRTKESFDKWTLEKNKKLANLVDNPKNKSFQEISKRIPGHSSLQCRRRWTKSKKGITKGQWSIEEDRLLEEWIQKVGPRKWEQCGKFINSRSGKQCREHWSNCLNPQLIKGEWTYEEDFLIMHFYEKCNGSWKKIIQLFNGRTENSIKNRFFSQLRKIATKYMDKTDKKSCAKIKLDELKNYLKEGLSIAKRDFLEVNPMTEEELNKFISQKELKMKQKMKEEKELYESHLSNNFRDLENSLSTCVKNESKDESFLKKRKRSEEESLANTTEKEKNKIIDFEELENEKENVYNSFINLDENNYNPLSNIMMSSSISNENSEEKTYINEENKEIKTIINNEEYNEENSLETNNDSRNSNAFALKFEGFNELFLENEITNRANSLGILPIFGKFPYGLYDKPYIDFSDKKNVNLNNNEEIFSFCYE